MLVAVVDRFLITAVWNDREHRTEDLLACDRHGIVDVGKNSGPHEIAARQTGRTARSTAKQGCAFSFFPTASNSRRQWTGHGGEESRTRVKVGNLRITEGFFQSWAEITIIVIILCRLPEVSCKCPDLLRNILCVEQVK